MARWRALATSGRQVPVGDGLFFMLLGYSVRRSSSSFGSPPPPVSLLAYRTEICVIREGKFALLGTSKDEGIEKADSEIMGEREKGHSRNCHVIIHICLRLGVRVVQLQL